MSDLKYGNIFEAFSATVSQYPDNTAVEYLGTKYSYRKLLGLVG
jgi:acyl-CoA synthetase (AMP-forming)/AMP-acid ligase II